MKLSAIPPAMARKILPVNDDKLAYEKKLDIGIGRLRNTSYPRHLMMSIFSPNYSQ